MENNSETKQTNKTNKLLIVIIVILSLCLICLGTFIVTTLLAKPTSTNEASTVEKEASIKEIKDIDTITELSTKIDTIVSKKTNQYYKSYSTSGYRYRYSVLKETLSAKVKQTIVLDNITWETIPTSDHEKLKETELYKTLVPGYGESFIYNRTKQVSLEKASEYSEELFGEKITTPIKQINDCPSYFYEETMKSYYYPEPQCGGLNFDTVYTYKSKFEEKNDETYVYVSFGYVSPKKLDINSEVYSIYKDFDLDKEQSYPTYKNIYQSDVAQYIVENFEINSENYQEFSEYKFTFKKDKNNNYYFIKVEQTK